MCQNVKKKSAMVYKMLWKIAGNINAKTSTERQKINLRKQWDLAGLGTLAYGLELGAAY